MNETMFVRITGGRDLSPETTLEVRKICELLDYVSRVVLFVDNPALIKLSTSTSTDTYEACTDLLNLQPPEVSRLVLAEMFSALETWASDVIGNVAITENSDE